MEPKRAVSDLLVGPLVVEDQPSILAAMGAVSIEALEDALHTAWSPETSAASDWTEANCAKGQCAVTACVVQDYLGGDILNSIITLPSGEIVSHYFNVIGGEVVDLTRVQFPPGAHFSDPRPKAKGFSSTRDYCLSYDGTMQRYNLLCRRVTAFLRSSTK